jgi:hypothetical protein
MGLFPFFVVPLKIGSATNAIKIKRINLPPKVAKEGENNQPICF